MATFNAGSHNVFTNVMVADHIDNHGHHYGADPRADLKHAGELVEAMGAIGLSVTELVDLLARIESSGGLGPTTETRTFYDAFKRTLSIGGEAIRTLPGLDLLNRYLHLLFP